MTLHGIYLFPSGLLHFRLTDFENQLRVTKGDRWGEGWTVVWDGHTHTELYGMVGQQGPAVQHRELSPIFYDHSHGKKNLKKNGCLYMYN